MLRVYNRKQSHPRPLVMEQLLKELFQAERIETRGGPDAVLVKAGTILFVWVKRVRVTPAQSRQIGLYQALGLNVELRKVADVYEGVDHFAHRVAAVRRRMRRKRQPLPATIQP